LVGVETDMEMGAESFDVDFRGVKEEAPWYRYRYVRWICNLLLDATENAAERSTLIRLVNRTEIMRLDAIVENIQNVLLRVLIAMYSNNVGNSILYLNFISF